MTIDKQTLEWIFWGGFIAILALGHAMNERYELEAAHRRYPVADLTYTSVSKGDHSVKKIFGVLALGLLLAGCGAGCDEACHEFWWGKRPQPCPAGDQHCIANRAAIAAMEIQVLQNWQAQSQANLNNVIITPVPYRQQPPAPDVPAMLPAPAAPNPPLAAAYSAPTYSGKPADTGGYVTATDMGTGVTSPMWRMPIDPGGHTTLIGPDGEEIHAQVDPNGTVLMQDMH